MNRNSLLAIVVLAMVGTGLGIVSAQWMAPQSPVEDTVLYGAADAYNNGTGINATGSMTILLREGKMYIGDALEPPRELTPEEKQETIDIALADSEVQELLDGREYEIGAVRCLPYPRGEDMQISVRINIILNASEDGLAHIVAIVDPDEEIVVKVVPIHIPTLTTAFSSSGPMPPPIEPLTLEEEEHAIDIALSDPDVQELLEGREYNVSGAYSIPPMLKMEPPHLDDAVNGTDSEYGVQEISIYMSSDRYASVRIDILNGSENMTAYMKVVTNLNESIMERLSFEMSRGGGLMMSPSSMPVTTMMMTSSVCIADYAINESDDADMRGYGISIFDAEP